MKTNSVWWSVGICWTQSLLNPNARQSHHPQIKGCNHHLILITKYALLYLLMVALMLPSWITGKLYYSGSMGVWNCCYLVIHLHLDAYMQIVDKEVWINYFQHVNVCHKEQPILISEQFMSFFLLVSSLSSPLAFRKCKPDSCLLSLNSRNQFF